MLFSKILISFTLLFILFSCKDKDVETNQSTWIGGHIINPKLDYVVFSKGNQILDTVQLDANNFFLLDASDFKAGLYTLGHFENQIFYLEPGDSLMLHINTIDFDESLYYSGKGGGKNNLLMEFYLLTQNQKMVMPDFYQLPEVEFEKKLDSMKNVREALYTEFLENNEVDEEFKKVALANIKYNYYSKKELYITANEANNENPISEKFYSYRKDIDFGNEAHRFYYPYYHFLNRYFDNLAFSELKDKSISTRNSYSYHYKKLMIIDSLVTNDSLKNSLLRNSSIQYLITAKNAEEENKLLDLFLKLNNNPKHKKEIEDLAKTAIKLAPGNRIHNLVLVNQDNVSVDIVDVIKKPTVIYFWSYEFITSYRNIHSKVAELKSKYPEYDFIGINTDSHFKKWLHLVKNEGYKVDMEFQFENKDDINKLIISSVSKAIILDRKSIILEGNSNLFNPNFESLLLGYLNK